MIIKKFYWLFVFFAAFIGNQVFAQSQKIVYNDSWGNAGINLISQKSDGVEIIYSIKEFTLIDHMIKGEMMKNISLPGVYLFNDEGMPDLPGSGNMIAVPNGADVSLEIVDFEIEKIQNLNIAPAPNIPVDIDTAQMAYIKNEKIYSKNAFYPENPVIISEKSDLRGVENVMVGITPFQYNPITKELLIYKNIKLRIHFKNADGGFGNDRLRCKWWDPILAQNILNYNSLPKIDYSKRSQAKDGEAEYLILTINQTDFLNWADTIAEFRRKQGISTDIYTTNDIGGNTVAAIETWINNAYNNWSVPPSAVLILADYSTGTTGVTSQMYTHPAGYPNFASDNHFADVNGNDIPDIVFARITANNATQLQVMISKFMNYEQNPPTDVNFYNHPITALGWQTERWFQLCSEVVGGFWNNELGKSTVRINAVYSGNPNVDPWSTATNTSQVVNYFGPNGLGYIPATPQELGGFSGGTATMVVNAINAGSFVLQHRDHGEYSGWGEPAFQSSNINSLNNVNNKLPYIFSVNCQTGAFHNTSECFAEKFHRHTYNGQNSGALGVLAATEVSYSFVNDVFIWGAYDNMWPEFMPANGTSFPVNLMLPAFANAAGKVFLQSSGWPYNTSDKQVTYRLFHHHGDAFLNLYSEVPQELTVTANDVHVFGLNTFDVTVDTGADIALTYYDQVNNKTEIVAVAESNGSLVSLDMTNCPAVGTVLLLTVTKQNYYRYTKTIQVIAPNGPYVIAQSFLINDGNNNSAEYGESFNLDIALKNVGTVISQNITATLTTGDAYVSSLTNATSVAYPNLNPGSTSTSSGKFCFLLADNVPDQHTVLCNLSVTDNSTKTVYNSNISFKVNAPVFNITNLIVDDASGNGDGILDPGETANIIIQTGNTGHADVSNVIGYISSTSPYLILNSAITAPVGLLVGETGAFSFGVTADAQAPVGTLADISFDITGGLSNQYTGNSLFDLVIGFVPVYCEAGGGCDEYISRVVIGTIDNSSSCDGYYDYTDISTDVVMGSNYPITITVGTPYSADALAAYVDWNYDGDFEDSNETYSLTWNYSTATATGNILVPEGIIARNVTMRIRLTYSSTPTPCGSTTYGEVEDYTLSVMPNITQGGTLATSIASICIGSSTGTITLSNNSGTITDWEKRLNSGTWTSIGNTANTYSETPSETGTWDFRVEVDNGAAYSNTVSIIVSPTTVGGSVNGGSTICESENTGTLTLSGHTGSVLKWQKQLNGGSWSNITNTQLTYSEVPVQDGTWIFRAVVKSGACSEVNSNGTEVVVNPSAVSGTASANNNTICTGSTVDLNLSSTYQGSIQWQSSQNGTDWSDIPGAVSSPYTTDALTINTWFRAVVSLGDCPDDISNQVAVTVLENPVVRYSYVADNQTLTFTNLTIEATSYNWDFGDGNTSTETNPVHIYSASGNYTVVLSASNGVCPTGEYSESITVNYVGIDDLETGLTIIPNPSEGKFIINAKGLKNSTLNIYNVNGLKVFECLFIGDHIEVDLKNISNGVYFIEIISNNHRINKKLIIE
jgi:hypothetical protein